MSCIGFDTSNYTTSTAVWDSSKIQDVRSVLPVERGKRGIRQSEGVFLHTKNISKLYSRINIDFSSVRAVGASTRPRSVEGSYMPVFLVGKAFAEGVAHSLGVPLFEFSHQDGHIMAGIVSSGHRELLDEEFISVHLSGGTTEILRTKFCGGGFFNEIIGGTRDISAGQLIDRIGVWLGMRFPCGKEFERLALSADTPVPLPPSVRDSYMYFSGAETKIRNSEKKENGAAIAAAVLNNVRDALIKTLNFTIKSTGLKKILAVGGVASNSLIRRGLTENVSADVFFASPELSSDNAVGIAALAQYQADMRDFNGTENSNRIADKQLS